MRNKLVVILLFLANILLSQNIDYKIVSANNNRIILSDGSDRGLYVADKNGSILFKLSDNIGASFRATFSKDGRYIAFKNIELKDEISIQTPVLFDLENKEFIPLEKSGNQAGIPSFSNNNDIAFTKNNNLFVYDANLKLKQKVQIKNYVNIASISPDGNHVILNDSDGQLYIIDLISGKTTQFTDNSKWFYNPFWSSDGSKIAFQSINSDIFVFNLSDNSTITLGKGNSLFWDNNDLFFIQTELSNDYKLLGAKPVKYNPANNSITVLQIPQEGMITSFYLQNGDFFYTLSGSELLFSGNFDKIQNIIYGIESKTIKSENPKEIFLSSKNVESFKKAVTDIVILRFDSVYFNQVYDVRPDRSGIGTGCCGAASALMGLMYYKVLPEWGTTCYSPYQHYSPYANYISEIYTFKNVKYDISYARDSGSSSIGWGIYGWIYRNELEDTKGHMAELLRNHGVSSTVDWSPTWSKVRQEITNSFPFVVLNMLTTSGHYIVCTGYVNENYTGIFNDPYGNRNYSTYLRYTNTIRVKYDWPGYNNGFANLNSVGCLIYMRQAPDLTVSDYASFFNGDYNSPVKISFVIRNEGVQDISSPFKVKIYLSDDNKFDSKDSLITTEEIDALPRDHSVMKMIEFHLSKSEVTRTYYFIVVADPDNIFPETFETNNQSIFAATLIGKPVPTILYPYNNSTMTYTKSAIYVTFDVSQQIDTSSIKLVLNNKDVSSLVSKWDYKLIYYPPAPYTDTVINVSLYLKNKFGYDSTFNWKFYVQIPNSVKENYQPDQYILNQNYPNPFNPSTQISFFLPKPGYASLKIHDVLGREINTLADGYLASGFHNITFDINTVPNSKRSTSGIYFYTLRTDNFYDMKKMVMVK